MSEHSERCPHDYAPCPFCAAPTGTEATTARIADVLAEHQRIVTQPGGPCWCGEWPRDDVRRDTWMDHVAEVLSAGVIRDMQAELRQIADEWEQSVSGDHTTLVGSTTRARAADLRDRATRIEEQR